MKILFLTPQLPYPPRQGTQIRNYHLLRAAASTHQVDLLSFARQGEETGKDNPLIELCGQVKLVPVPSRTRKARLRSLITSPEPDMAGRLVSPEYSSMLSEMLRAGHYDAVQVEAIEMARYIPAVRSVAPAATLVFDEHNAEYLLQARAAAVDARSPATWPKALYSVVQWARLSRYEAQACGAADAVIAVSKQDASALRKLTPLRRLAVVPNGVDTDYYHSGLVRETGQPLPSADAPSLLFTGTMDFRPNVDAVCWFASRVLPIVRRRRPDVRFYIVGRSPSPAVLELATRHPRVTVTGPVDDVRPYFAGTDLFVAPIRMGGGVRLKILEALSMGLPAVATHLGAEGIDLVDGKEILLSDTPHAFAAAVLRLLEDELLRRRLAVAGRRAAEERFDWNRIASRLLEVYGGVV